MKLKKLSTFAISLSLILSGITYVHFEPRNNINTLTATATEMKIGEKEASGLTYQIYYETVVQEKCGDNAYWSYNQSGTLTISGSGKMYDYSAGISINTAPWEMYKSDIKHVVIQDGITNIGSGAFDGCEQMEDIYIPNTVTEILFAAFQDCKSLSSISLPDSVTFIDTAAFNNCDSITELILPKGLKKLAPDSLSGLQNVKKLILPEGLTAIENGAIPCGLEYLFISKNISSVKIFGINLKHIVVDEDNKWFSSEDGILYDKEKKALIQVPAMKEIDNYTSPDTVCEIKSSSFYQNKVKSINLTSNVNKIESGAFIYCNELTEITLSDNVKEIYKYTFYGCESLSAITLPVNIEYIENYAFQECSNLKTVIIKNPECIISDNAIYNIDNLTISGYKGSTAEIFAKKYNYNFISLDLSIDKSEITLKNGDQYIINANQENLSYKSNNEAVAIVSKKGVVTALSEGTAKITIYNSDNETVQLIVKVSSASDLKGDTNNDATITVADLVMLEKWLLGGSQELTSRENADINSDGSINAYDMVLLRKLLTE